MLIAFPFLSHMTDICKTEVEKKLSHFNISFLFLKMKADIILFVAINGSEWFGLRITS